MFNFFVDASARVGGTFRIGGKDHNHICNVLRMQPGDTFLVSCEGASCLCRLAFIETDAVIAEILEENYQNTELPVHFYLFQGLPKGDKLELVIEKAVECVKAKASFEEVYLRVASSTITCHCGKGTLGVLYLNDGGVK